MREFSNYRRDVSGQPLPDVQTPDYVPTGDQIRAGDPGAWETWIAGQTPALERIATRVVGSNDASDVVQEAWVKAYRARKGYKDGNPEGFMTVVTRNRAIDVVRQRTREVVPEVMPEPLDAYTAGEGSEEYAEIVELVGRLKEVGINPDFVDVLALRLTGANYNSIADQLGVPRNTVATRLRRGGETIKKLIQSGEADGIFDPDILAKYKKESNTSEKI